MESLSPECRIEQAEILVAKNPEIAGIQAYEYFRSDVASQRDRFIDGEALDVHYANLTVDSIRSTAIETNTVLSILMGRGKSEKSEALFDAIEYRYAEMFLVELAARMNDDNLSDQERAEACDWFKMTNEALYGTPKKEVFSALANQHIKPLLDLDFESGSTASRIQNELVSCIGYFDESNYRPYRPSEETVQRLHDLVHERFDELLDFIDPDKTYTAEEMVEVMGEVITRLGGDNLGWRAKMVENSTALAVSAHQKLVEVGEGRKDAKGDELRGKALHEGAKHAGGAISAELASWPSAQYGQDGYLPFEEAAATALEDTLKGKFVDHGVDYQLIAGLAYGQDNHTERDFRDVYEVMWRYRALARAVNGDLSEEGIKKSQRYAFTTCVRLFRGTDMNTPGLVMAKDLAYFDGQELAWSFLDGVQTQEDLDLLFAGKLDLTRPDHLTIANEIVSTNAI